jgi:hypothetical protein
VSWRTETLDPAIEAYRAEPSEANRERLAAASRAFVDDFYREQASELQARTH